jgi:hypothetical protein
MTTSTTPATTAAAEQREFLAKQAAWLDAEYAKSSAYWLAANRAADAKAAA